MTNNTDPIYVEFKDKGISAPLVLLISIKVFVCLIGIILNGDLVLITWKTKNLRGACNVQIALNAFSICIQQSSTFVTLFVVLSGKNFISLIYCGIIQIIPLFFSMFTNGIALSIGVDRLLSVLFPIWYALHDKRNYLVIIIISCCIYSVIVPVIGLKISLENPEIPVICTVIDTVQKEASWIVIMMLIVNLTSVFCYINVWIILMFKKSSMKKKQINVFKSLSMILLMEICGWITNYLMRIIVNSANNHSVNTWYLINISTIAPYIAMSLSPVSLYIFSSEYNKAFINQFTKFISPPIVNPTIYPVIPYKQIIPPINSASQSLKEKIQKNLVINNNNYLKNN
uniref:G-protein coupled receptors family 1 profile domain-containing protein n=1 Tax=Meloidogyne enterolobii TaxID=390850 RepID=A0A6V7UZZ5_MELEN|nr:unnamed protein product [Meloidogyne enterolobii]